MKYSVRDDGTLVLEKIENEDISLDGVLAIDERCVEIAPYAVLHLSRDVADRLHEINGFCNVEIIGKHAFQHCRNLRTIDFTYRIKRIGEQAFNGCQNFLGNPDGSLDLRAVEVVDNQSFCGTNLQRVFGLENLQRVGVDSFAIHHGDMQHNLFIDISIENDQTKVVGGMDIEDFILSAVGKYNDQCNYRIGTHTYGKRECFEFAAKLVEKQRTNPRRPGFILHNSNPLCQFLMSLRPGDIVTSKKHASMIGDCSYEIGARGLVAFKLSILEGTPTSFEGTSFKTGKTPFVRNLDGYGALKEMIFNKYTPFLEDNLRRVFTGAVVRNVSASQQQIETAITYMRSNIGKPLRRSPGGVRANLEAFVRPFGVGDEDSEYCSQMVRNAFRHAGVETVDVGLSPVRANPAWVAPNDFLAFSGSDVVKGPGSFANNLFDWQGNLSTPCFKGDLISKSKWIKKHIIENDVFWKKTKKILKKYPDSVDIRRDGSVSYTSHLGITTILSGDRDGYRRTLLNKHGEKIAYKRKVTKARYGVTFNEKEMQRQFGTLIDVSIDKNTSEEQRAIICERLKSDKFAQFGHRNLTDNDIHNHIVDRINFYAKNSTDNHTPYNIQRRIELSNLLNGPSVAGLPPIRLLNWNEFNFYARQAAGDRLILSAGGELSAQRKRLMQQWFEATKATNTKFFGEFASARWTESYKTVYMPTQVANIQQREEGAQLRRFSGARPSS